MTLNRNHIPQPGAPRLFHFPEFERIQLSNGLKLIYAYRNDLPLVNLNLCIRPSVLLDPPGKEGLANITAALMDEGTAKRSSTQTAEDLEMIGAQLDIHADWKAVYLELNTLEWHLEQAVEIFSDIAVNPAFPQHEFDRIKKELIAERMRAHDNAARVSAERFTGFLYKDLRYAVPVEGTKESIENLQLEDVQKFFKTHFLPSRAVLIAAGSVDKEKITALAEKYFGGWQGMEEAVLPDLKFNEPDETEVYLIDKPGAAQCELRMGHLGIERSNPDYYAVTLMNEILGGFFLSRINMNLREKHAYTYGANSGFTFRPGKGPFSVSAAVHNKNIADAVREVLYEIRRLQDEPVGAEELENARGQLIEVFPIAFETIEQTALGLANIFVSDLEDDYYHTFREKIAAISSSDVQKAAQKYLHPDQTIVVVCGSRKIVEQQLAGHYKTTVYDSHGRLQ